MWSYHPELLETPVPRYTSYPTAADFGELSPTDLTHAIEGVSGDISLYLHIPFCESICHYCGCNTGKANRKQRVESYLAAIHTEIETVAALLPRDARVRRIAFGGGSPNALEPGQFLALVDALGRHFQLSECECEWSIELDPRSMNTAWGEALSEAGITRASMGVQTFSARCQKAIGREQSDIMICRSIDWLRSAGVTSLNFDLMYGLPHQREDDLADSLEYTKQLGADRIAVFGYAHVPQLIPRQRMIDASALPDARARFDMAAMAHNYLTSTGYDAIGFDHFALPTDPMALAARTGTLRRNFQGFSDDPGDVLIGLGASAISGFPHLIAQNDKNNGRYRMKASQGMLTATAGVIRGRNDQMRGNVIEDLLCKGTATLPPCIYASCGAKLDSFIEPGLARFEGMTLVIEPAGLPYARVMAAQFDQFRDVSQRRFSSAI